VLASVIVPQSNLNQTYYIAKSKNAILIIPDNNMSEKTKAGTKAVKKSAKKTVNKSSVKSVKKTGRIKKKDNPDIESRVVDYLYNPETKEKIEPPKEETLTEHKTKENLSDNTEKTEEKIKKRNGFWPRFGILGAKIIFLWIPVALFSLVLAVLIIMKALLTPSFVEDLAKSSFNTVSSGTLDLKVKNFDPYRGFVIENIAVLSGEDFNSEPVFSCEKVVLDYSFFSLFIGDVLVPEVGIYKPSIFLTEKNGVWNIETLMLPKQESSEEEKKVESVEPKPTDEPMPQEIKLPIAVSILFNFIMDDLYVKISGSEISAELTEFDINTNIDIPDFKTLPIGPKAVELIDKLIIHINPDQNLRIKLKTDVVEVQPPLLFTFNLILDKGEKKDTQFYSDFKAGTLGRPVRFNGASIKPLNMLAEYNLSYDAVKDILMLNRLGVTFAGDRWIDFKGEVTNLVSAPEFNIVMAESNIDLGKLYPYYVSIIRDETVKFGGTVSLKPMLVKGTPEDVKAQGDITMESIIAMVPGFTLDMPSFVFGYDVQYKNNNVLAKSNLQISRFNYKLERFRSGSNTITLDLNASAKNNFSLFDLSDFDFQLKDNRSGLNALSLKMSATADLAKGTNAGVNIHELVFRKDPLINTLPSSIGDGMKDIPLTKAVTMNMKADYVGSETVHKGVVSLGLRVPDYDVNDLTMYTSSQFNMENKVARIDSFRLSSASYGLNLSTNGYINTNASEKSPFVDSDIRVSLKINQKKMRKMYDEWKVQGLIGLNAHMKGDLDSGKVNGNIIIEDLSVNNPQKDVLFDLEKMNMKFPFLYSFKSTFTGESKTAVDKSKLITNRHFKETENFTIKSIRAKHPSRKFQYEYLKDFNAIMQFKNNSFDIEKLQATVLNGSVYLKDTFFYLADMDINNMEYNLAFDAINIDIGKLDDPNKKTHESDLSLTARLSGKGLNVFESVSTTGYVTIYKIGEDFANNLMKALSTKKGKSMLGSPTQFVVDNAMALEKFYFYIDKGNIYAKVPPEQRLITKLTFIKVNDIEFVRMPVQEFMRNLSEGEEK